MNFLGLLRTFERITRPPWVGHDVDALEDMEAEMDRQVGESRKVPVRSQPRDACRAPDPADCLSCGRRCWWGVDRAEYLGPFHVPDPFPEPALTDDELVAVRGLIQERYEDPAARERALYEELFLSSKTSAPVIPTGADAEPDSPAASAAGVSPSEACDIQPSPSEGRPTTPTSPVIQCHCGIHPYIISTDIDTTKYICPDHGLVARSTTK